MARFTIEASNLKHLNKPMNILVTGAAGFIGSHVVDSLLVAGHRVIGVDNLSRGVLANLNSALRSPLFTFSQIDVRTSLSELKKLEISFDCVVHLASVVGSINLYEQQQFTVASSNLDIDSKVLQFAVDERVSRYVYASSGHVYPKRLTNRPECELADEGQAFPAEPALSYGWAKLQGEILCRSAATQYDHLSAVSLITDCP